MRNPRVQTVLPRGSDSATAPLRDIRIDAGHWLDFWESTFNDTGGLRVQLNVPEYNHP